MALSQHNIKVELREILLKDRPNDLLKISPKGTVPVLQLSNEKIIDESLDIMYWTVQNNKSNWTDFNFAEQKKLIQINDKDFKYYLDRYKYSDRYPEKSKTHYQKKCMKYLTQYEDKLNNNIFLVDDEIQIVDIAIFPFIRQYAHVDRIQFPKLFPKLDNYLKTILNSKLFNSVMDKYPVWNLESKKIITDFN
tara:strand:- start:1594 stop:2172 length:579 start_codon:yes stop_codon:yes gene_type:complete